MDDMALGVWADLEKQRIDEFVRWWNEQRHLEPQESWPLFMPHGEWDEQYRAYTSG
jgi:hypothetical protein